MIFLIVDQSLLGTDDEITVGKFFGDAR